MIHTNRIVTVGEQESIIDRPIVLYRGDREVEIEFTLVGNEFTFSEEGNVIKSVNASHGQLVLNTPSGEHMFSELAECHEGKVVFVVTKEMIDEFVEMGFYSFQIRLYDSAEMKSRVTIPPVMNGFDIRNPIAAEDETNVVDQGIVNYARVFKDQSNEELPTFTWDGEYIKTEWAHHDVITENKMNKIEDALYSINANIKESDVVMLNTLDQVKKDADAYVKEHMAEVEADVEEFERNLNTGVEQFKIDTNAAMTAHKNEVSEELESVKDSYSVNLLLSGAVGDGVSDDSAIIQQTVNNMEPNGVLDLCGKSFYISNDITLTSSITIQNGVFILENSSILIPSGVSYCSLLNVIVDGVNKDSDGVSITYPSMEHRFINCVFKNCASGLKTISDKDTEQRLYVSNCSFLNNTYGIYSKDLKRHTIIGNKFVMNEVGYYSYTKDYEGLGLIFNSNYLNANQQAIRLENGLYDSTFCANVIDHNNYIKDSSFIGCGMYLENSAGRHFRNLNINGNAMRNNGDYSIIIIINGNMNYCSISNNSAHLAGVKDMKIDYSNAVGFSNNVFTNNNFIAGYETITNGTDLLTNNARFSTFAGGNIRGKTMFNNGLELGNSSTFVYTSNKGYMQYYSGDGNIEGLYVVQKEANKSSSSYKKVLVADYVSTTNRPTNAPAGFMLFDYTINKPIWRTTKGTWVDATGAEV